MRFLVFILCLALASPALADRGNEGGNSIGGGGTALDRGSDHDRARNAVERHEILPLKRVLEIVGREYGGRVIEVELQHSQGRYLYELKLISADGRIVEVEVDAATGLATDGSGKTRNEKAD